VLIEVLIQGVTLQFYDGVSVTPRTFYTTVLVLRQGNFMQRC